MLRDVTGAGLAPIRAGPRAPVPILMKGHAMQRKTKTLLSLAIASGFAAATPAFAGDSDWRNPQRDMRGDWRGSQDASFRGDFRGDGEIRGDLRELRGDRVEIRRDQAELRGDARELRND